MHKFPLFFNLTDRLCVVVGGGNIAHRRVQSLLSCGARVLVVAPTVNGGLQGLCECGCLCLRERAYVANDLADAFLVLACTDDSQINKQVTADARNRHILCNNASDQDDCDFFFPAIVLTEQHTIGLVGDGSNHKSTRALATKIRTEYGV